MAKSSSTRSGNSKHYNQLLERDDGNGIYRFAFFWFLQSNGRSSTAVPGHVAQRYFTRRLLCRCGKIEYTSRYSFGHRRKWNGKYFVAKVSCFYGKSFFAGRLAGASSKIKSMGDARRISND